MLWIEKYRPKTFDEIISHQEIASVLKEYTIDSIPNIILYGQNGHNKKTMIYCLLNQLFGKYPELKPKSVQFKINSKEIDVNYKESDEIIEISPANYGNNDRFVIQKLIKEMAENKPILSIFGSKKHLMRIILINDAENLSRDAQAALRRTMETYSNHFRIFMMCNEISRVIDPIRSRCLFFRIRAFKDEEIRAIFNKIISDEDIKLPEEQIEGIIKCSEGNMKKALCLLEITFFNAIENNHKKPKIEPTNYYMNWEVLVNEIVEIIMTNQTTEGFVEIRRKFYELLSMCIDPDIILLYILKILDKVSLNLRQKLVEHALKFSDRMRIGNKPLFHLEAFAAALMLEFSKK